MFKSGALPKAQTNTQQLCLVLCICFMDVKNISTIFSSYQPSKSVLLSSLFLYGIKLLYITPGNLLCNIYKDHLQAFLVVLCVHDYTCKNRKRQVAQRFVTKKVIRYSETSRQVIVLLMSDYALTKGVRQNGNIRKYKKTEGRAADIRKENLR